MCKEALPEHIDEVREWAGTDHDKSFWKWLIPLKIKYLAFGPRDSHKWHKWREWPITLFAAKGDGFWRFENDITDSTSVDSSTLVLRDGREQGQYLSRNQHWCRWSFQLQWPLFVAFHWYFKDEYVGEPVGRNSMSGDRFDDKLLYFYIGAKRDADKVYWVKSLYLGKNWK